MPERRASTDQERAPLLGRDADQDEGFIHALTHPSRPLTNLERLLTFVGIVLLVLSATFVGLFASTKYALDKHKQHPGQGGGAGHGGGVTVTATTTVAATPTGKPQVDVCLTPECVQLSASILSSLNTSVDPCENFYEFANGGWLASHSIPDDATGWGTFEVTTRINQKIVLKIIETVPPADQHNCTSANQASAHDQNLRKLRDTFDSCMDIDELNSLGLKPIVPLVHHIADLFGPFDLIPASERDSKVEDTPDWTSTYTDDYELPLDLVAMTARVDELRASRQRGGHTWEALQAPPLDDEGLDVSMDDHLAEAADRINRLTDTVAWLHSRGVNVLFRFSIQGDSTGNNSQIQGLHFYQAFGGLPAKGFYEETELFDLYQQVIKGILVALVSGAHGPDHEKRDLASTLVGLAGEEVGHSSWPWPWPGHDDDKQDPVPFPDRPKDTIEQRMGRLATKVVQFERELIRAGADFEKLYNPLYSSNTYALEKVDRALPFVDLRSYLQSMRIGGSFPEKVVVTHPPYLKSVSRLVEETPDHILSAYFVARLAFIYAPYLGPETALWQEVRRLDEVLEGLEKGTKEDRQATCLRVVDKIIPNIAGAEFVREVFSPEAKKEGTQIITNIIDAFYNKLPHISWMDQVSAEAAQRKAKSLLVKVGYSSSPDLTDPKSVAAWYDSVEIHKKQYLGNALSSVQAESRRRWKTLGRKRDRRSWAMYPHAVNAYYSAPDGEIVFPAGILQPSITYSYSWPSYLNYGSLGAIAAHELTHAFDNSGAQYDEHGLLRDWWTNSTVKAFQGRAQCIARQYSRYYVVGPDGEKEYVNGELTNGEDIGDSGLVQAFQAWKTEDTASLAKPLLLPGLEHFTEEQMFFIGFGRVFAQLVRPAWAVVNVHVDTHSPNKWRVIGTLRNSEAFHNAFQCKEGSRASISRQ